MEFFTADMHFFHSELLKSEHFSPRPFQDLASEHAALIERWNNRVKPSDTVYHLGDFAMLNGIKPPKHAFELVFQVLMQLNGHIVLVKGNHDSRDLFKFLMQHNPDLADGKSKFTFSDVGLIVKAHHHQFFLTHYPLILGPSKSSINLHGHIHHDQVPLASNLNVGIDSADFEYLPESQRPVWGTPLNLDEIDTLIQSKQAVLTEV